MLLAPVAVAVCQNLTWWDSGLLMLTALLLHAGSSCASFSVLVFGGLYTKKCIECSLADMVPLFSIIRQFTSELDNNRGSDMPFLCPS